VLGRLDVKTVLQSEKERESERERKRESESEVRGGENRGG
jgi:hypothetical protein